MFALAPTWFPQLSNPFNQITAGEDFTLKCRPDVHRYTVAWYKDGNEVNASSNWFSLDPITFDLVILNPQEGQETEGRYSCTASNEYGSLSPYFDIVVQIACK